MFGEKLRAVLKPELNKPQALGVGEVALAAASEPNELKEVDNPQKLDLLQLAESESGRTLIGKTDEELVRSGSWVTGTHRLSDLAR